MANVAAGTVWNLPNYTGELFTSAMLQTPFLSAIGGLTGGVMTDNFEFATDSQYSHEDAAQPSITETDSLTAPTAISYVRDQSTNVTQIFQEAISISYARMSNQGRMQGINTAGQANNVISELTQQINTAIEKIARDTEYTFLNGVYQKSTASNVANTTRGIIAATVTNALAAAGAPLAKSLVDSILRTMHSNGAVFNNLVIMCNGFQKQKLSDVYGYAPEDRNIGGLNIKQIETDFGNIGVMPAHRFMPIDTVQLVELSACKPVFQTVPGYGNFFYEPLAKTGASEKGQLFGQIGLDHSAEFIHGKITGLATA